MTTSKKSTKVISVSGRKDSPSKVTKATKVTKAKATEKTKKAVAKKNTAPKEPQVDLLSEKIKSKTIKVKVTKQPKIKIKISKPAKKAEEKIKISATPSAPIENDSDVYNKTKLTRAITNNLIPIEISPLKITLAKQPPIKKDDGENRISMPIDIQAPLNRVWEFWSSPQHIKHWFIASKGWSITEVQTNFKPNGNFLVSMTSEDGKETSDFQGEYIEIVPKTLIAYVTKDGFKVVVTMNQTSPTAVKLIVSFEPEEENSVAIQKLAWDNVLKNFKNYTEKS